MSDYCENAEIGVSLVLDKAKKSFLDRSIMARIFRKKLIGTLQAILDRRIGIDAPNTGTKNPNTELFNYLKGDK